MIYDCLIVGAGPAGLSASIFTLRAGLKTICIETFGVGGQAALSYDIANYPGFASISGIELTDRMYKQAEDLGLEMIYGEVLRLDKTDTHFVAHLKGNKVKAKKVIIACGSKVRKLGIDNEERLRGRGVSYCASCDGGFYKHKIVAVVGGGNTAIENVTYLSNIADKVYLIHRSDKFRANDIDVNRIRQLKNVEIITHANVIKLEGDEQLERITINKQGVEQEIKLNGIFVSIGYVPDIKFIDFPIETDDAGYIKVDQHMRTSVDCCYAAGDIVSKDFRQVITACADGAIAGNSCIGVK